VTAAGVSASHEGLRGLQSGGFLSGCLGSRARSVKSDRGTDKGVALGFRRGPDTWVVRLTARDQKRTKTYHALEDLNLDYDAAKEKAEAWIEQTTHTAVRKVKRGTVRAALEAYLADLIKHNRAGRLDRTINRQVRSVVAALNRALELGHVGNPLAWKLKKLSDDTEDTNETAVLGPDGVKKDD